jgi:hypothetical protein
MISNNHFVVTISIIESIIVDKFFFLFLIIFFMSAATARILTGLLLITRFFCALLSLLTIHFIRFGFANEIYHFVI